MFDVIGTKGNVRVGESPSFELMGQARLASSSQSWKDAGRATKTKAHLCRPFLMPLSFPCAFHSSIPPCPAPQISMLCPKCPVHCNSCTSLPAPTSINSLMNLCKLETKNLSSESKLLKNFSSPLTPQTHFSQGHIVFFSLLWYLSLSGKYFVCLFVSTSLP